MPLPRKSRSPKKGDTTTKTSTSAKTSAKAASKSKEQGAGPIAFFLSIFIIALGAIQLLSAFHTYAINLGELNSLKKQEAALIEKKQELENDIDRWNDKSYVTAQARERLGFVFPGESSVRVNHPEAVTGDQDDASTTTTSKLPWYEELSYSFEQADSADEPAPSNGGQSSGEQSQSSDQSSDGQQQDGEQNQSTTDSGDAQ